MIPDGRERVAGGAWPQVARAQLDPVRAQLTASATGILLCGPAGIGKTQLALAVRDSLGVSVTSIACSPGDAKIPLTALDRLIAAPDGLLPDSRESAEDRLRAHLDTVGGGRHVVVLVDDVQWLDDASADVIASLVRAGAAQLLGTARSTRSIPWSIRRLLHDDLVRRVDVQGMSGQEVLAMLERLFDAPVDHDLADELVRVTGGNALFLREAVRAAMLEGGIALQRGVWASTGWRLPTGTGIAELVDFELDRIAPEHLAALELVALSQPVTTETVVAALDDEARDSVDALVDEGLVVTDVQPEGTLLRIAHPVYGERIRSRTPARRRRALHQQRYADVDVTSMAPGDFLRWTTWAVESDLPIQPEQLLRAAQSASALGQDRFALRMAEAALARLDEDAVLQRSDALLLCSWQRLLVDDAEGAMADVARATEHLQGADGARDEMVLRLYAAHRIRADIEQFVRDDVDAALATMRRFVQTVPEGPAWHDVDLGRARRLAWAGDPSELRPLIARLDSGEPAGPDLLELVAPTVNHLAWAGDSDRALAIAERHWDSAEAFSALVPWLLAEIHVAMVNMLIHSGRLKELEEHPRVTLDDGVRRDHTMFRLGHAYSLIVHGHWAQAWGEVDAAVRGLDARDPSGLAPWAAAMAADVAMMTGKWSVASQHLSVVDAGLTRVSRGLEADARWRSCRAALGLGVDDAIERIEGLATWAHGRGYDLIRLDALHLLALADPARLRAHLASGAPLPAVQEATPAMGLLAAHVQAVLDGDTAQSRAALSDLAAVGRWAPTGRRSTRLTPREAEVAGLVAGGLTSPEVADRLRLSTRTVETHVSRVMAKLGVSRRHEVATALAGPGSSA